MDLVLFQNILPYFLYIRHISLPLYCVSNEAAHKTSQMKTYSNSYSFYFISENENNNTSRCECYHCLASSEHRAIELFNENTTDDINNYEIECNGSKRDQLGRNYPESFTIC